MSDGIRYNQRDIVLIPFPYSDLTGAKQRPALILSNKKLHTKTPDTICCLITSNEPKDDGILLETNAFAEHKLPLKSWVKPHRLFTIHARIIRKKLCSVTDSFHDKIVERINEHICR